MKKLYTMILALGVGAVVNAQTYDISVEMTNYTNLEATSDDPMDLEFTVTNDGADIPSGDSIYWAVSDGTNVWTTDDLTPDYVMYTILSATFTGGQSFTIPVADITMEWMYENIGLTGMICVAVLGVNVNAATPPTMSTPANDAGCVNYTVTQVAGLDGVGMDFISVYPNPAVDVVNFEVGNNEVSHINVFDMSGRLVNTILVSATIETISTDNLENGLYMYQMMNGEEMIATDRFVVAK